MTPPTTPVKLPQWKNDLAVVLRVAVGAREYILTTRDYDDKFTHKMQRQFTRVASSVGLTLIVGAVQATLRDNSKPRHAFPIIVTQSPRELAVTLLAEYNTRGGKT